jgi:CRP-like cAMP-binding protein
MNGYAALADSCLERLLGGPTNNMHISRAEGSILFAQGEKSLGIYALWEGRVKVSIGSENGKSRILGLVGRGDVLGLPAAILGLPHAVTAETVEPVKFSFVAREDLLRRLRAMETAAWAAAEIVSAICLSVTAQLSALHSQRSAEQKVACFLVGLLPISTASNMTTQVSLEASQEEIGQMIGVCRETVARVISRFKKKQILELRGSTLIVHDRGLLEKLTETQEPRSGGLDIQVSGPAAD